MDPNSTHQLWSLWTATITVPFHRTHSSEAFDEEMRSTCARFYRKLFGLATELRITKTAKLYPALTSEFVVECRTEGAPVPDPVFRRRQMNELAGFFGKNLRRYGRVNVHVDVRVEAGDVGDGKPRSQLILGPPVALMPRATLLGR